MNKIGTPLGLPHSSQYILCKVETLRNPELYGVIGGYKIFSIAISLLVTN
jgi:hypothetical protein